MKRYLIVFTFLASVPCFADYACTATRLSPGPFGTHYPAGHPTRLEMAPNQNAGYAYGEVLASVETSYGSYEFTLNGALQCRQESDCSLEGQLVGNFIGTHGVIKGSAGTQQVQLHGKDSIRLPLIDDELLEISCDTT